MTNLISASAPSNIALIKYMGKVPGGQNRPTNSSFSYTLDSLRTFVEISELSGTEDQWQPLEGEKLEPFSMSEKGKIRFLAHFRNLKSKLGIKGSYLVKSANNFPSDCGLASSASSFAALTRATVELADRLGLTRPDIFESAELSRQGSGSSCRSFFGPWVLWGAEGVRPTEFQMGPLHHTVIVVQAQKKDVSSSEAHQRVLTSPLFRGRPERAEARLAELLAAFRNQDWMAAFQTTWSEFWDMHALFETSVPAFGYFQPETMAVLKSIRTHWDRHGDGPLVTMDAGANVHLLYRDDQRELQEKWTQEFSKNYSVFSSQNR